jgi:hypothetical protein
LVSVLELLLVVFASTNLQPAADAEAKSTIALKASEKMMSKGGHAIIN